GDRNAIGFQLKIIETENGVKAEFLPKKEFEGYQDIIHGGIVATLLDEMIAWACRKKGYNAVTAELQIRYKKPMVLNKKYYAYGKISKKHHRLIIGESEVFDEEKTLIAYAQAKMYLIS
ncbi:MAG: PaaI family thioesterase, partial [candidate division WOR-3 bacterium]|nr:PaaI family thioesterase [candidate division WOR-3 bacterium]